MATTEQFSLRWNNFHTNLTSGFHELLEAADMVDVTLAVDGHFLQAHKIVLSICSPFFKQMFKVNPCKHPVVILKDIGHENMKDILEFMYMGEVSVLRENLTQFLRTAELLQVKGLTGDDPNEDSSSSKENKSECDNNEDDRNDIYNQMVNSDFNLPPTYQQSQEPCNMTSTKRVYKNSNGNNNAKRPKSEPIKTQHVTPSPVIKQKSEYEPIKLKNEQSNDSIISMTNVETQNNPENVTTNKFSIKMEDNKDLMNNMKAMWENTLTATQTSDLNSSDQGKLERQNKNIFQCGQCLKRFSRRDHLRTHEKNIHGEFAGPFKCAICEQLYKNTESLRKHIAKFHFSTINESIQRVEVNV